MNDVSTSDRSRADRYQEAVKAAQERGDDAVDNALTRRLNDGDDTAFVEVYDRFAPDIFKHARFRISNESHADEIAQQVFLQTWEYLANNTETTIQSIRAFLYGVAHNMVVDWYRRQSRRPQAELTDAVREQYGERDDKLASAVEDASDVQEVRAALADIKKEYRDMIIWRFVDELDVETIAELADKTANNVYVTTHRALEALRRELDHRENDITIDQ